MFNYVNDLISKEYSYYSNDVLCDFVERKSYRSNLLVMSISCGASIKNINLKNNRSIIPTGTAHLLEHLIMSNKRLVNRLFEKHGVILNAVTTYNETYFTASGFQNVYDFLEDFIPIIFNPDISSETIDKEKDIIRCELDAGLGAKGISYYKVIYKTLVKMMFSNELYSNDVIGDRESIDTIEEQHIIGLFNSRYNRNNTVMSLFLNHNDDHYRLTKHIHELVPEITCSHAEINEQTNTKEKNIILDRTSNNKYPLFIIAIKDNNDNIWGPIKGYILKLIITMHLYYPLSPLINKAFKTKLINNNYNYKTLEFNKKYNSVFVAQTETPHLLKEYVKSEILQLAELGMSDLELNKIKQQILINLIYTMEKPNDYCKFNSTLLLKESNLTDYFGILKDISVDEINKQMKSLLSLENFYTIICE